MHLSFLNDETLINARFQHLDHLSVVGIIADVLENVTIRRDTKSAEDHPNGNIITNIWETGTNDIAQL
jgi:hypothetical protein